MHAPPEPGQFRDLEERLIARFSPPMRPEDVERCLTETVVSYQDARVTMYLAVLIERAAVDHLQAIVRQGASPIHLVSHGGAS